MGGICGKGGRRTWSSPSPSCPNCAGQLALHPCVPSPLGAALYGRCCLVLGEVKLQDMVVFLGRHLPALLEVFKKGEWV